MDIRRADEPEPGGQQPAAAVATVASAAVAPLPGLRLGEDSFRRVVEWSPSAMVLVDQGGIIVLVNIKTEQLFKYSRDELIGRPVEVLLPERFREHHRHFRSAYYGYPKPRPMGAGRDLTGVRSDNTEFPIEIGLNPIDTAEGGMVLASIIDITERLRTQQHLEDALREKTMLLNEVHHRVKNNLQIVTSLLNLQAAHVSDPRLRAILGESCGRVKAMALTHQLLYERKDFSQLDLADYLQRLVQAIRAAYSVAGGRIALRMEIPADGVPLDLERSVSCGLLINELVTNAYKHAFPADGRGEIVVGLRLDGDERIGFGVADDGVGSPPEEVLAQGGSLGLQLVPLFVEQLHGEMTIERGNGTRFWVSFPKDFDAGEAS